LLVFFDLHAGTYLTEQPCAVRFCGGAEGQPQKLSRKNGKLPAGTLKKQLLLYFFYSPGGSFVCLVAVTSAGVRVFRAFSLSEFLVPVLRNGHSYVFLEEIVHGPGTRKTCDFRYLFYRKIGMAKIPLGIFYAQQI
jgi:hypothetical protein